VAIGSGVGPAFVLVRYRRGGALDPTFGRQGKVRTDLGISASASDVAIQDNGKIVAVGEMSTLQSDRKRFALTRYRPDGSLDRRFGGDGQVTTTFMGSGSASAVAIQADAKIVVAGYQTGGGSAFALARYNAHGVLDPAFGGDGKVVTLIGSGAAANAVAIQPDGKILAAGYFSASDDSTDWAIVRYNDDGSLDPTFDGDGILTTHLGGVSEFANDVVVQPDGKIVVAGSSGDFSANPRTSSFALARYEVGGTLDATFSGNGKLKTGFGHPASARGIVIQTDGRIVAAGESETESGEFDFAIARYTAGGLLDATFGNNGKVVTDFGHSADELAADVALEASGKIVVAGVARPDSFNPTRFAVTRYVAG
jgi:uncharacterized delta-60 repeat protein